MVGSLVVDHCCLWLLDRDRVLRQSGKGALDLVVFPNQLVGNTVLLSGNWRIGLVIGLKG